MKYLTFLMAVLMTMVVSCEKKETKKYLKYHGRLDKLEGPEAEKELIFHFPRALYKVYEVKDAGKFYIDSRQDLVKNKLLSGQGWEPEVQTILKEKTRPGTTAIDVGAHIGTHSLILSDSVGERGRVIAFEPDLKLYSELVENLELNEKKNVTALRAGLGDEFSSQEAWVPSAYIIPLDSLGLDNVSLIKIDVPGEEETILKGAEETLLKNRPFIVLEISGNRPGQKARRRDRVENAVKWLQERGYDLFMINNNYNLWFAEPL